MAADMSDKLLMEGTEELISGANKVVEKDIDGLPLRDHKKVDLKTILGHFPQVDDEDQEAEDIHEASIQLNTSVVETTVELENDLEEDVDQNETGNMFVMRQRRSSLRTQHHEPPDSPTGERKAVRFADSLGLGLEAIRDLADAEEPPEIPHSALTALRLRRRRHPGGKVVLSPKFQSPTADGDAFRERLTRQKVLLESSFVCSRELTVSGIVQVTDVSDEKSVTIRYTTDCWATHRDVPANYVPNSNDGTIDRFVFIIHLPDGFGEDQIDQPGHLEFAVAFHAGQNTYWDNNDGENYIIDCFVRSRESSVSGESKSPVDPDTEISNFPLLDDASGQ